MAPVLISASSVSWSIAFRIIALKHLLDAWIWCVEVVGHLDLAFERTELHLVGFHELAEAFGDAFGVRVSFVEVRFGHGGSVSLKPEVSQMGQLSLALSKTVAIDIWHFEGGHSVCDLS